MPGTAHQVAQQDQNRVVDDVFSYDGRGNMLYAGDARHIAWTSFNKPSRITRLDQSARFAYNSEQQRMLKVASRGTTWYAGDGLYERFRDGSSGRETFKYPIRINGQQVAYVKQNWLPGGTDPLDNVQSVLYLLADHLGSVSQLLDSAGMVLESLSFDAWGQRRAGSWRPLDAPASALTLLRQYALTTGFTGHEMDEDFGLINMQGRLYDSRLGRFVSADPFVQFANNTQSYNRYSYVLNNPLSHTDPTGYFLDKVVDWIGDNIRTIAAIAVGFATAGLALGAYLGTGFALTGGGLAGSMIAGAAGAFAGTLVATGSLEAAVVAGVFGGLSGGLAHSIGHGALGEVATGLLGETAGTYIAHGVAQGTVSALQGGKFRSGFLGGVVGHAAGISKRWIQGARVTSVIAKTMIAAAAGGLVSSLTGGKFANGAMSAAFTHCWSQLISATR
ncbi:MAG TPA: RHS repeat-associated core domain-containing protein [Thiolinea sp.]|nr:RHS repeat-associated core domain-containing protein [Thiolinea sp.]